MVKRKTIAAVSWVAHGGGDATVAARTDVVGVVGSRLMLVGRYRHMLAWIVYGVGVCIEIAILEDERGTGLVLR